MVCAWALVLDQVTAEVEGALSSALESDDVQALIDACDLAKAYGLESTAAKFEEAKERVEQKSREVGDDDHASTPTFIFCAFVCVWMWCPLWVAGLSRSDHHGGRRT